MVLGLRQSTRLIPQHSVLPFTHLSCLLSSFYLRTELMALKRRSHCLRSDSDRSVTL